MSPRPTLAERAAAVAQRTAPTPAPATPSDVEQPAATSATRVRPVRLSIDLAPITYRDFKRWCDTCAETLGLSSVRGVEVVRLLVETLVQDDDLGQRVRARIAASRR